MKWNTQKKKEKKEEKEEEIFLLSPERHPSHCGLCGELDITPGLTFNLSRYGDTPISSAPHTLPTVPTTTR